MKTIGIDFGTGNTVLAEWLGNQSVIFDRIGNNGLVCSDVAIDHSGNIIKKPINEINDFSAIKIEKSIKRRLIKALENEDEDEIVYLKQLCVIRLKYIFDLYKSSINEKVIKVVLTCPANTGQAYRSFLVEVAKQVGLPSIEIVDEPTAAAVYYGLTETAKQNERWMVIDWGCGTCDISLVERTQGSKDLKVVCVEGDNNLGGIDFDILLSNAIVNEYKISIEQLPPYAAEEIKKELSDKEEISYKLTLLSGKVLSIHYTRARFEDLINHLLVQFQELIQKALQFAGWTDSGVDRIVATGGPILIPCVKNIIQEFAEDMGADLFNSDPMTSVAKGAARLAELKRLGGLVVTNKVAKSIGVRISKDKYTDSYHRVILRGENRPVTRQVQLGTSVDFQDIVEIEIREGDNQLSAINNTLLAKLRAIVKPAKEGDVKINLQLTLSDSGSLEAYIEQVSGENKIDNVQAIGIRLERGQNKIETDELRTYDPISEFNTQVVDCAVDPDTARQVYERLKTKYHPDRKPQEKEYWNNKLKELDTQFNVYIHEINKQMLASSVPDLPWNDELKLKNIIVDDVLANRLTHCLANNIGNENQLKLMPQILKLYPDYRRVVASYLFGIKQNMILQQFVANDDRPQVGLVVLLQNIQGKSIKERHEVLKSVYRVNQEKIRELLTDDNLDIQKLFDDLPKLAEKITNPVTKKSNVKIKTNLHNQLKYEYIDDDTIIKGNTYPVRELIKKLGGIWNSQESVWLVKDKRVSNKELFGE